MFFYQTKNKQKIEKKCNIHNIFYNTFTILLSSRLLQPIIDGKKIIIVIFSKRKKKET